MSAQARPNLTPADDARRSGLMLQHAQALKAGDHPRALAALQELVNLDHASKDPFPQIDAEQIFAPLEPLKYVIRGIDLCPGAPALWAGYGYSKKTVSAQSAALTIASGGGKVWGAFEAPEGRVLHIDYEQGSRLTRERYQRLAHPMMVGPADLQQRLVLVALPGRYLDQPTAESDLARLVEGFTLVIVDSLKAAAPTIEENSSDARSVLDRLTRVSEKTGATFVVIHHARKPNQNQLGGSKMAIRGSGALFDACGSVLVFEGEKGRPTRVSHEKARASGILAPDFELDVSDVPDGSNPRAGLVVTAHAAPDREAAADSAARDRRLAQNSRLRGELRELFEREPEQGSARAIAEKIGRRRVDVAAVLELMADAGEIEATGKTNNRRHRWLGTK